MNEAPGSTTSMRWQAIPPSSAGCGLLVPTSQPTKTWRESAETSSPSNRRASVIASAVLPLAVGPTTPTSAIAVLDPASGGLTDRARRLRDA